MPDVSRLASACPDDAASPRRPIREGRKEFFPETASQGTVCLPPATALPLPLLPCGTDASARQRRCGLGCGEIGGGCLPRQTAGGTLAVRSGCVSSHWMGYWGERETAKGREKEKKRKNETACSSSRYRARRLGGRNSPAPGLAEDLRASGSAEMLALLSRRACRPGGGSPRLCGPDAESAARVSSCLYGAPYL